MNEVAVSPAGPPDAGRAVTTTTPAACRDSASRNESPVTGTGRACTVPVTGRPPP
ncbi:hypothetical protein ACFQHO_08615 [Actinomadura yumaensis]|uniref:hypothetical protein n=1 Tax=Actinomadura yumaensis TaxID=111807 RepID=UPI00361BBFBF